MEFAEKRLIAGGGASPRRYWRCRPAPTAGGSAASVVLCEGTVRAENEAFVRLTSMFRAKGLPVAEVLERSADGMSYLLADLGDDTLCSLAARGADPEPMCAAALKLLPRFQLGAVDDYSMCYPVEAMDRQAMMWDLNYFKYCFVLPSGAKVDEPALERDFARLCSLVEGQPLQGFMLRDFQGRNIMFRPGDPTPWFIDYQGGRRGPLLYDAASLLWQARLGLDPACRERLAGIYLKALREAGAPVPPPDEARRQLRQAALLRVLQTLGAYGLRGLVERKPAFITPIAKALANARELAAGVGGLPALEQVLADAERRLAPAAKEAGAGLTVRIASFGFRKSGPPADPTGNGGGFVYDCRALPNPGRLAEFKSLTGRDAAVADWLEACPQVEPFVEHAFGQVDAAVDNYLERGFDSLMASFGCTGGQHRSVYCACRLARHLREKYPQVNVEVTHTEQPQLDGRV